jgi:hypothetical protein
MNKIDIIDGFYRVAFTADSAPKLAIKLPTKFGEPTLVVIPAFCAITEMVADITNRRLPHRYAPPH